MSRIDDIRKRQNRDYYYTDFTGHIEQDGPQRDTDIRWMLDRIAKLDAAAKYAKFAIETTPQMNGFTQSTALELISDALAALDNDDEKETTHGD